MKKFVFTDDPLSHRMWDTVPVFDIQHLPSLGTQCSILLLAIIPRWYSWQRCAGGCSIQSGTTSNTATWLYWDAGPDPLCVPTTSRSWWRWCSNLDHECERRWNWSCHWNAFACGWIACLPIRACWTKPWMAVKMDIKGSKRPTSSLSHLEPPRGARCRSAHISPTPAHHRHQQHSYNMSTNRPAPASRSAITSSAVGNMTRSATKTSSNKKPAQKTILSSTHERTSKHTPSTFSLDSPERLADLAASLKLGWHKAATFVAGRRAVALWDFP